MLADTSLCMLTQIRSLFLYTNSLTGNVPESWRALISVCHCYQALHLMIDFAALAKPCKADNVHNALATESWGFVVDTYGWQVETHHWVYVGCSARAMHIGGGIAC